MDNNWWDRLTDNHKGYGGTVNYKGKLFVSNLIPDDCKTVLDIGCGNGLVYKALKELGRKFDKYKGIDSSHKMIEACQDLYSEAEWQVGDANKIDEQDNSYDVVMLFHVLESMTGYKEAIKEALRIAKQKVIVVFWTALSNKDVDNTKDLGNEGYMTLYSASEFFKFLKELEYDYTPWVELYTGKNWYNLYFSLIKEYKRADTAML